jgi:pyridoxamine 5'-phosphate oxidase
MKESIMDKKEILEFINKAHDCFFATVEGDKPHVRPIGTFRADENGLVYSMQSDKDVYKQLVKNPEIEVCYYSDGVTVRVSGRVEQVNDLTLRKAIMEERPFLKPGVDKEGWDYVGVFILKHGKASVMDMKSPPGTPKAWIDL